MTACLRAISLGSAVPRLDFETTVHSAFRSAANLQLAGETALLTLLLSGQGDLPQGIRVEAPQRFTFEALAIGTAGSCRDGVLTLGRSVVVDLRHGKNWECDLSSLDADMTNPAAGAAWRCVWHALSERRERSAYALLDGGLPDEARGHQTIAAEKMRQAVRRMLDATGKLDAAGMQAAGSLVGLGPGLTPVGDDLLTGYLAGLWCATRGKVERRAFVSAVGDLVIRFANRTNDIGRTYLCHAARGQVASLLADLAAVICKGGKRGRVLARAEAAMDVGHTSGMAAVHGLLLGLSAWDGQHLLAWDAPTQNLPWSRTNPGSGL